MRHTSRLLLALLAAGCGRSTASLDEFLANDALCGGSSMAVKCNTGTTPPDIQGTYAASGTVIDSTIASAIGSPVQSTFVFSGQKGTSITMAEDAGDGGAEGSGVLIHGTDLAFTVYLDAHATIGSSCSQRVLAAFSGVANAAVAPTFVEWENSVVVVEASGCEAVAGDQALKQGTLTRNGK